MISNEYKFINCTEYEFTADDGKHYHGYSCKLYDTSTKQIIKAKSDYFVDKEFGDVIKVGITIRGNYVKFYIDE